MARLVTGIGEVENPSVLCRFLSRTKPEKGPSGASFGDRGNLSPALVTQEFTDLFFPPCYRDMVDNVSSGFSRFGVPISFLEP